MAVDMTGGYEKGYLMKHRTINKEYYNWVVRKLFELNPDSVIDVGGNHVFLTPLSSYFCRNKILVDIRPKKKCGDDLLDAFGITFLKLNIFEHELPKDNDVLICLQMIEHLEDPSKAVKIMWDKAKTKIFSVPYKWDASLGHLHNDIDEKKFFKWFPRKPDEFAIVRESCGSERIIGVWKD